MYHKSVNPLSVRNDSVHYSTFSFCVALQSFGPVRLFQFLDTIRSRYGSLDGGSARRKAATYTQNKTKAE
jgi:hypothetical protein